MTKIPEDVNSKELVFLETKFYPSLVRNFCQLPFKSTFVHSIIREPYELICKNIYTK